MDMLLSHSTIQLNNEAAQYIHAGWYDIASQKLSEAVVAIATNRNDEKKLIFPNSSTTTSKNERCQFLCNEKFSNMNGSNKNGISGDDQSDSFVFSSPIMISNDDNEYSGSSYDMQVRFSVHYNLGLALHLKAINDPRAQVQIESFQGALAFYQTAHSMAAELEESPMSLFYSLAVMNNVGQIHKSWGNLEKATECFEYTSMLLFALVEGGFSIMQLEGFLRNVDCVLPTTNLIAPAA